MRFLKTLFFSPQPKSVSKMPSACRDVRRALVNWGTIFFSPRLYVLCIDDFIGGKKRKLDVGEQCGVVVAYACQHCRVLLSPRHGRLFCVLEILPMTVLLRVFIVVNGMGLNVGLEGRSD